MLSPNHAPTPTLKNQFGNALQIGHNVSTLSLTFNLASREQYDDPLPDVMPSSTSGRFGSGRLAGALATAMLLPSALGLGIAEASTSKDQRDGTPDAPLASALRAGDHESVFDSPVAPSNKSDTGEASMAKNIKFITPGGIKYRQQLARWKAQGCPIPVGNTPSNNPAESRHKKLKMKLSLIKIDGKKYVKATTHEKAGSHVCGYMGQTASILHGKKNKIMSFVVKFNAEGEFISPYPVGSGKDTEEVNAYTSSST